MCMTNSALDFLHHWCYIQYIFKFWVIPHLPDGLCYIFWLKVFWPEVCQVGDVIRQCEDAIAYPASTDHCVFVKKGKESALCSNKTSFTTGSPSC